MATKNIVPRANAQGQLGTDAKKWDKHIAVTGSFITVSGSVSGNELTLVSGSAKSTGSFGHILKGGVNWDTAVSTSAATAGFGTGGGSSFTAAGISGSWQSYSLISGSGQIATAISGAFTATSSSLASRITTREAFITQSFSDGTATKISGSAVSTGSFGRVEATKVAGTLTTAAQTNITSVGTLGGLEVNTSSDFGHLNIPGSGPGTLNGVAIGSTSGKEQSGAFTTVTTSGNISGSSTSTGSFGHIMKGGVNWDTAVSASAATAGFGGGGGGSDDTSWNDGTATKISGSAVSTGSFGHIQVAKNFLPTTDNNSDLGSANKRWANIHSADLQLSNEGTEGNEIDGTTGNWTIQEGEDDLYLLNRKNGKKYRFKLQEID